MGDGPTLLDDDLRAATECRLITTGRSTGQPRRIVIWFAAIGDRVFMLAGGREQTHWVRNIEANPVVQVEIRKRRFEGRGRIVEGTDVDPVARDAIAGKYGTKMAHDVVARVAPGSHRPGAGG
jgi:deazaflavin-dependent oxidoreductase (nitroreductase family)